MSSLSMQDKFDITTDAMAIATMAAAVCAAVLLSAQGGAALTPVTGWREVCPSNTISMAPRCTAYRAVRVTMIVSYLTDFVGSG